MNLILDLHLPSLILQMWPVEKVLVGACVCKRLCEWLQEYPISFELIIPDDIRMKKIIVMQMYRNCRIRIKMETEEYCSSNKYRELFEKQISFLDIATVYQRGLLSNNIVELKLADVPKQDPFHWTQMILKILPLFSNLQVSYYMYECVSM